MKGATIDSLRCCFCLVLLLGLNHKKSSSSNRIFNSTNKKKNKISIQLSLILNRYTNSVNRGCERNINLASF